MSTHNKEHPVKLLVPLDSRQSTGEMLSIADISDIITDVIARKMDNERRDMTLGIKAHLLFL